MDLRKIKKLIELVEESGIAELEVRDGEEAIRIARPVTGAVAVPPPRAQPAQPAAAAGAITAPMAGTFYAASEPGAEPYLEVGQRVEIGDVVCIIESMKMMNEIVADRSGTCLSVAVGNGQAVASGQVLFNIA
ncbi:MAG: acetyl-CoA carboxylase biotin carboxyl carrier protein [Pseudomonadales bacterium]|nr:acetyl-CoA carboxylase biotin carboxyl carrier protein [Pseudomonadales bacterium]NIX09713.1 acetyl-CoA carboxylase biotin carboxyl carrier protein [Pseudomonadales bacterium]